MQRVSEAYKTSMKQPLRNRGYIKINFGLINEDAMRDNDVLTSPTGRYGVTDNLFDSSIEVLKRGAWEQDFIKVDGSQVFPEEMGYWIKEGKSFESYNLLSEAEAYVKASFWSKSTGKKQSTTCTFKGLTINFGQMPVANFQIESDGLSETITVTGNTETKYQTTETFTDASYVTIRCPKDSTEQYRLRIEYILFGIGIVFNNEDVIDSTLTDYVSPVAKDVPQTDFSVTLKNYDHRFNFDNPDSIINFIDVGQSMEIYYGYDVEDDDTEWIKGGEIEVSSWSNDDTQAVINGTDVLRSKSTTYVDGLNWGRTLLQYARSLCDDMGVDYKLDETALTKDGKIYYLPKASHKELLQMIANVAGCSLRVNRNKQVEIVNNKDVVLTTTTTYGEESYSKLADIWNGEKKVEYGTFQQDYITVDGGMYFLPESGASVLNTGYVSKKMDISDSTTDILNLTSEGEIANLKNLTFEFGNVLPTHIYMEASGSVADSWSRHITDIERITTINDDFDSFNELRIEFTNKAGTRTVLNNLKTSSVSRKIEKQDITSSLTCTKDTLIKDIIVPYTSYSDSIAYTTVIEKQIKVSSTPYTETLNFGDNYYYRMRAYINDASWYVSLSSDSGNSTTVTVTKTGTFTLKIQGIPFERILDETMTLVKNQEYEIELDTPYSQYGTSSTGITTSSKYNWKINFTSTVSGSKNVVIYGRPIKSTTKNYVLHLNDTGEDVTWSNPLITTKAKAQEVAEWLRDEYYADSIYYEYDTRGYPELDPNDLLYQENEFVDGLTVRVQEHKIGFNGGFYGHMVTRRREVKTDE